MKPDRFWRFLDLGAVLFVCAALLLCPVSCGPRRPPLIPDPSAVDEESTGAVGWIELADGTFHEDAMGETPKGFYVKGYKKEWQEFVPTSEVMGKALKPKKIKTRAWIELGSGDIVVPGRRKTTPRRPYVAGCVAEDGTFYPDPPKVVK